MTFPEDYARRIFEQAIAEDRCGEVLDCLFDGGSVTIDASTGRVVLASGDALAAMVGDDAEDASVVWDDDDGGDEIAHRIVRKIANDPMAGRTGWDAHYIDVMVDLNADELALLDRLHTGGPPDGD